MKKHILFAVLLFLLPCCAGAPVKMNSPAPDPERYEVLGEGYGKAVGIMLFQVIPCGQNSRFQRAYDFAVKSKGGDKLLNPQVSERWFWAWLLNGYVTSIKGTVVREKNKD